MHVSILFSIVHIKIMVTNTALSSSANSRWKKDLDGDGLEKSINVIHFCRQEKGLRAWFYGHFISENGHLRLIFLCIRISAPVLGRLDVEPLAIRKPRVFWIPATCPQQ